MPLLFLASLCVLAAKGAAPPSVMRAVQAFNYSGAGASPDWTQVLRVAQDVAVPKPGLGQVLIQVYASSVNPVDWKILEGPSQYVPESKFPFTLGFDVAGVVAGVGLGVARLRVGDAVFADVANDLVEPNGAGAYAQYVLAKESEVALKPDGLNFTEAATIPLVGLTSLESFTRAGAPWDPSANTTVVVMSGPGGTGFTGLQLAKKMGAGFVATAASSRNFDFCRDMGADRVVDYHETNVLDTFDDDSVDVVYDNFGAPGTADKAMAKLRPGGTFVYIMGSPSKNPKKGVKQVYVLTDSSDYRNLDTLRQYNLRAVVQNAYPLDKVGDAFSENMAGGVVGKVAIVVKSEGD